jgi:hypothetical protein
MTIPQGPNPGFSSEGWFNMESHWIRFNFSNRNHREYDGVMYSARLPYCPRMRENLQHGV